MAFIAIPIVVENAQECRLPDRLGAAALVPNSEAS